MSNPPFSVTVEGQKYKTVDWSYGGFRIRAFHRKLVPGDLIEGIIGPVGRVRSTYFVAEVKWVSEGGEIGLCRKLPNDFSPIFNELYRAFWARRLAVASPH